MVRMKAHPTLTLLLLFFTACMTNDWNPGLYQSEIDDLEPGPRVVFDLLSQPDPEIPYPNDIALRFEPGGNYFLNVSKEAATAHERLYRRHLNEVPGFSAMSPISVSFDGPIDLSTVTDDSILVINIKEDSHRYGEMIPLRFW